MDKIRDLFSKVLLFEKEAVEIFGNQPKSLNDRFISFSNSVSIITSTIEEFNSIREKLINVEEIEVGNKDSIIYYKGEIKNSKNNIKIVLPFPLSMGIESTVLVTTKVLNYFNPKYIFMVGICAGNKNLTKIGDIIIAEKSLNYNEIVETKKEGKESVKKFMQTAEAINKNLKSRISLLSKTKYISEIREQCSSLKNIPENLTCHIGLLVTGSSLVRSGEKIKEINESYYNVKGLDMETYGFYYAANNTYKNQQPYFASIKAVSDYGDETKHKMSAKERKNYALYTSSAALIYFIKNLI